LLLIEPERAAAYEAAQTAAVVAPPPNPGPGIPGSEVGGIPGVPVQTPVSSTRTAQSFHASVAVNAPIAKARLVELSEEIIALLCSDPHAAVRVTVEISADFPYGVREDVRRAVSENARSLSLNNAEWE
jgi:uncharacterized protein